ncbi:Mrp/NBP35 family ATP-binding protein [Blattabacterium cuenoti]|uniref:Mrp/NBP35 family ATP-binding protein n=1 Tax=Blattabacterium cuenoti TaxID=1653831 RepID=UPI00163B8B53|nr:Mrp/NBP35 family ATP-binding protein [Blattabacterium cuenoti]
MKDKIENILKNIIINNINIIESNYVKHIDLSKKNEIIIHLSLPNPTMHLKNKMIKEITKSIRCDQDIGHNTKLSINIESISQKKYSINNIIAIASGKGGVGKSTIASNIAVSLSNMGYSVGLLDADIYGPSIPLMFNINIEEDSILEHEKGIIKPIYSHGIKILSIGFFSKYGQAIPWRGPMVTKAVMQFVYGTYWGNLDFLIIDFPPGTGDIHLSILQEVSLKGIVVVSTSQKIAISDVARTVEMFRIKSIYVPILGIIENMSYFIYKEKKFFLFGENGVKNFAKKMNIVFLGEIPMLNIIQTYCDLGIPVIFKNDEIKNIFMKITKNMINQI